MIVPPQSRCAGSLRTLPKKPGSLQAVRLLLSPPKIARFRWITQGEILCQLLAELSRAADAVVRCCAYFQLAAAVLAFTLRISRVQ